MRRPLPLGRQLISERIVRPEERHGQSNLRSTGLCTCLKQSLKSFLIVAAASDYGAWKNSEVVGADLGVERRGRR